MQESQRLAEYAAKLKYSDLDSETVNKAKQVICDVMAVSFGAEESNVAGIWKGYCKELNNIGEATMWNSAFENTSVEAAAQYNGAVSHLLDMDDVYAPGMIHLAGITVPVALALGQRLHASGNDVIAAITAGYEVGARIAETIPEKAAYVWHTTGTVGTIAAGIVAGKLMGLDADSMNACLGNAASQAAGLWQFAENGAMTKTLHNVHAVASGIRAAHLCKKGFTGATSILEGKRAFFAGMGAEATDLNIITEGLGDSFRLASTSIKQYACGRQTHSAVDAMVKLLSEHRIDVCEIVSIIDRTTSAADKAVGHTELTNEYKHKFSIPYCITAYMVYGNLLDSVFHGDRITNPCVQALIPLVHVIPDDQLDAECKADPEKMIHELEIVLKNGKVYCTRNDYIKGDRKNPLGWDELTNKFDLLANASLGTARIRELVQHCKTIDSMKDINSLFIFES